MRLVDGRDPRVIFGVVVPLYIYAYISNVQYRGTLYVGHMFHLTTCLDDIKLPFVLMTPRSNIIYIYIYILFYLNQRMAITRMQMPCLGYRNLSIIVSFVS